MTEIVGTLCVRITTHCNLSCGFCRAGSSPASSEYIDLELFIRFVMEAMQHLGLRHVSINGGEPGLAPRLKHLVESLVMLGCHVTITTNGTSHTLRTLYSTYEKHPLLIRIRVSLDGPQDSHDKIRGTGTHRLAMGEARLIKSRL